MVRGLIIGLIAFCVGVSVALIVLVIARPGPSVPHGVPRIAAAAPTVVATAPPTAVPTTAATPSPTVAPTATTAPAATPTAAPTATPVVPVAPQIASPTDPNPAIWYAGRTVTVTWAEPASVLVAGYSVTFDQSKTTSPANTMNSTATSLTKTLPAEGSWFIHVRALSTSGIWGPEATFPVNVDWTPLTVDTPEFGAFNFNPHFFQQQFWFDVSKPSQATVLIKNASGATVRTIHAAPAKAGEVDLSWDGKSDDGKIVPEGMYSYTIMADDGHGHQATSSASNLGVTYDRIVVSLSKQSVTAYDGNAQFLTSLATTGNQLLPTPVGTFTILAKYAPFTFHSPWPPGSPFYYPDSPVNYAMLFDDRGYYLHDAPWRSNYGPGSNAQLGTPGQDLTGSHGCVNVPLDVAQKLFQWAPTGTVIQVVP